MLFWIYHRHTKTNCTILQFYSNRLLQWCRSNRLKINPNKITYVFFKHPNKNNKHQQDENAKISCNGHVLPLSDETIYLGTCLHRYFDWYQELARLQPQVKSRSKLVPVIRGKLWVISRNCNLLLEYFRLKWNRIFYIPQFNSTKVSKWTLLQNVFAISGRNSLLGSSKDFSQIIDTPLIQKKFKCTHFFRRYSKSKLPHLSARLLRTLRERVDCISENKNTLSPLQ